MTPEEFGRLARKVVGRRYGWRSRVAALLEVDDRTVRRWLAGEVAVPVPVGLALKCLAGRKTDAA